ncbi:F-box protein: endocytic membrane traffic, recycling ReCYcling 1 [Ascosphaera pollenicola]|nr:F-box protein: endocytic membrane traffic, recycling ReCYcling 1 [Ascosphaera pollenicola]
MARGRRAAAKAAAESLKNLPPPISDQEDEEMRDVSMPSTPKDLSDTEDRDNDDATTEKGDDVAAEKDTDDDNDDEKLDATQQSTANDNDGTPHPAEYSAPATPAPDETEGRDTPTRLGGRVSATLPRKRRLGRPPKNQNRSSERESPEAEVKQEANVGTPPRRRGRGRPSAGGRWSRARGGPSHVSQVPLDAEGKIMNVVNDEVELPIDEEGETKVDEWGNLLGGREFRVRTFTVLNKGKRQYMLSTEPARCMGFRDSYLFFQKHRLLYKIIIDDDQKKNLISREIIPHSYKGRAIGVVTARSVFREFGAKIIIGGRKVTDDYYAKEARARGDVEGELAVPEDRLPPHGLNYNKNQYVAWHGASSVYHSGQPSVPTVSGRIESRKRRVVVTGNNWMVEHAKSSCLFNSNLAAIRAIANNGQYDVHTNMMQYPKNMQPTHVRWQPVPPTDEDTDQHSQLVDSASKLALGQQPPSEEGQAATTEPAPSKKTNTIFPSIPGAFARNFAIHDIIYESSPSTSYGLPGSATSNIGHDPTHALDNSANGLISIHADGTPYFSVPRSVLEELPEECMQAYKDAAEKEYEWKMKWRDDKYDGARENIILNYSWNAS